MTRTRKRLIDQICKYEAGELCEHEVVELFGYLVQKGIVYRLQGHYGRTARALIDSGLLEEDGTVNYEHF